MNMQNEDLCITNSSTAKQGEKREERGSYQTLVVILQELENQNKFQ